MGTVSEVLQNPFVQQGIITSAEALGIVALTTVYNHRELTHDSLKLGRVMRAIARTAMRAIGMNPYVWASVHTIHHAIPDMNLVPVLETADYLEWREEHPEVTEPPIPTKFTGLDPVAELSPEQIIDIGGSTRKLVKGRYDKPTGYSDEEASRLSDADNSRYFYDELPGFINRVLRREKPAPKPSFPERSLQYLAPELQDAHSPALHRKGVVGILFDNVPLYSKSSWHFEKNANRMPHLMQGVNDRIAENPKLGQRLLILGNIAIAAATFGSLTPLTLAGSVLSGYAMTGLMASGLRAGGNVTNSFGHGGKHPMKAFLRGVFRKQYQPEIMADGTYSADVKGVGSVLTFDETGGQRVHHFFPWKIAYSVRRGIRKLIDAPFGAAILEPAVKLNLGMSRGNNFGLEPGQRRPDEPTEATVKMQQARVHTLREKAKIAA